MLQIYNWQDVYSPVLYGMHALHLVLSVPADNMRIGSIGGMPAWGWGRMPYSLGMDSHVVQPGDGLACRTAWGVESHVVHLI